MTNASLIVSVVRKGWGSTVLEASVKAGARGGTVLFGRGAGINEQEKIFGMSIELSSSARSFALDSDRRRPAPQRWPLREY